MPARILDAAPTRPFRFIPGMFVAPEPGTYESSTSDRLAAEALGDSGSILDVGCGGGSAAFALVPPATEVIGVDRQRDMLDLFAATARQRRVRASTHVGSWPEDAGRIPVADVVVCHHVLYNVSDIAGFTTALDSHARRRVVIEITPKHPQDHKRSLWRHFWDLERPREPTALTASKAIAEAGFAPMVEESLIPPGRTAARSAGLDAAAWCRQLCLPPERQAECAAIMADKPFPGERVTIWWDTNRSTGAAVR